MFALMTCLARIARGVVRQDRPGYLVDCWVTWDRVVAETQSIWSTVLRVHDTTIVVSLTGHQVRASVHPSSNIHICKAPFVGFVNE